MLFVLASTGLTFIIVDGGIAEDFRNFVDENAPEKLASMIHCHQCTGFWAGLLCGFLVFSSLTFLQFIACGFAGSFLGLITSYIFDYLVAQSVVDLKNSRDEEIKRLLAEEEK